MTMTRGETRGFSRTKCVRFLFTEGTEGTGSPEAGAGSAPGAKAIRAQLRGYASRADAQGLLDYAALQTDHMSCANLSMAMHKLATLGGKSAVAMRLDDCRFAALHGRAQAALVRQLAEAAMPGAEVMPLCWATLAAAYAALRSPGFDIRPIFDVIAELSVPHLDAFSEAEFAILLGAFAKARVPNAELFRAARAYATARSASLSRSQISVVVWALVTAGESEAGTLSELTERFARRGEAERADPADVSKLMWGIATADLRPDAPVLQLLGDGASELVHAFRAQDLSTVAWAFSQLGVCHDRIFAAVASRLSQEPLLLQQMPAPCLANLLWALHRQKLLGSAVAVQLTRAMLGVAPRCAGLLNEFRSKELVCICRVLAEPDLRHGEGAAVFWEKMAAHASAVRGA